MYDSTPLLVNFARLQETSGHIQTAVSALESQLSQLEADARPLVDGWTGEAKQAYEQRQAIWREASTDLAALLRNIKRAVDESVGDYMVTEQRNTNLFR